MRDSSKGFTVSDDSIPTCRPKGGPLNNQVILNPDEDPWSSPEPTSGPLRG